MNVFLSDEKDKMTFSWLEILFSPVHSDCIAYKWLETGFYCRITWRSEILTILFYLLVGGRSC